MRKMAGRATLQLQRRMLIDKGTQGLRMTLRADCVLIRICLEQLVLKGAMGIMTITANQQSFIHLVVKGLGKGSLHIRVAAVAQLRLLYLQKVCLALEGMVAVAADTTYTSCAMSGAIEACMGPQMATEALFIYLFWRCLCESKDLGYVPTRLHVSLRRTVAALASDSFASVH